MAFDPTADPKSKKLSDWILLVQKEGLHVAGRGWDASKGDLLRPVLEQGRRDGILASVGPPSKEEITRLKHRFQWVRAWLLSLIIVLGAVVVSVLEGLWLPSVVVATLAGVVGSAAAALISCLDRRAGGFEAEDGTAYPDPSEKKERFGWGMAEWLVTRPALGLFMGGLVYIGIAGSVLKVQSDSLQVKVFWALLGGLFAKTLYDMLSGLLKSLVPKK
jgi:hypothetical protein